MNEKLELRKLCDQIDRLDYSYYNKSISLVSDQEYDGLKDRLHSLVLSFKPNTASEKKLFSRASDTATRIGAPIERQSKWEKLQHLVPMSSLSKCNTPEEFKTWHRECGGGELFITEKMDGSSISLQYTNASLTQAGTRGDGDIGEDITANVKRMLGVPLAVNDFDGHIRGEIVLKHSNQKYFLNTESLRNVANGIAKRLDGIGVQHLSVISYTIEGKDFDTEADAMNGIKALGFETPNYYVVKSANEAIKIWQEYMDKTRATLDYDIDGLVIRINDRAKQFSLGDRDNRPKGAIAFKFEAPVAASTMRDIPVQVGNTGHITPVAVFDPVFLLGTKVERASLYNFSFINEHKIDIGAEVLVEKANDVIPAVKSVIKGTGTTFKPPSVCPECGTKTVFKGEYLICPNKQTCPAQVIGRLKVWIKEHGILEWGEAVLQKLIDSGMVSDVPDLYKLTVKDLMKLDRMGEKSAQNLIDELDKFREVPLEGFIGGLNIEGVATSTVKSVIKAGYSTLDEICALDVEDLVQISGFGDLKASQFYDGLAENADRIENLLAAGVKIKSKTLGSLTGKSFCFTGTMSQPRPMLAKMVKDAGGEVNKDIKSTTNYLVIADPQIASSKTKAARKMGIKLISPEEFLKLVNG